MYKLKCVPEDFVVEELPSRQWLPSGTYTVFRVTKRKRNSEDVAQLLAQRLRVPRKLVNYAGTKDFHAVTTQFYSVKGVHKPPVLEDIDIEPVGFTDEPLSLGSLRGNRFVIVVRNVDVLPRQCSFVPNYYDDQRFSINNDLVGRCFVKGDFSRACQLVLKAGGRNAQLVRAALEKQPTNNIGALCMIPKKILTIYIHAYQSRLFNRMLEHILGHIPLQKLFEDDVVLPLIGFGSQRPEHPVLAKAYEEVMQEEDITERDFIIRSLPAVASVGQLRSAVVEVRDLVIGSLEADELHDAKKKVVVSFSLAKGAYATNVIKELFT